MNDEQEPTVAEWLASIEGVEVIASGEHPTDCECGACLLAAIQHAGVDSTLADMRLTDANRARLLASLRSVVSPYGEADSQTWSDVHRAWEEDDMQRGESRPSLVTPRDFVEQVTALAESLVPRCECGRLIHVTTSAGAR